LAAGKPDFHDFHRPLARNLDAPVGWLTPVRLVCRPKAAGLLRLNLFPEIGLQALDRRHANAGKRRGETRNQQPREFFENSSSIPQFYSFAGGQDP
jgi:hypothetical protein